MDLQLKHLGNELERIEPISFGESDNGKSQPPADTANVAVSYGIHQGRYPIGGMTVRDARQALQRLINIDPAAVAVINGAPVDENEHIVAGVTMLSFVKPSAMKGERAEAGSDA
jgi:hypothetical protein